MKSRQALSANEHLSGALSLPRDNIVCCPLEKQPTGRVKVFHHFSLSKKGTRKEVTLEFCYTPDRHILQRESAPAWLSCYEDWSDSWEALAIQLMDDFRNEIIPCWAHLVLRTDKSFRIEVEDRQPHWTPQRGIASSLY